MTGRALLPIYFGPRPGFVTFDAGTDARDRTLNPLKVESDHVRAWIERKDPRPIGHWNEIGREEYARAFTAARTIGHEVVDDLYFALVDTFDSAGTEVDFAELVTPILRRKGWLPGATEGQVARRLQLIYDTNLRLARASGRWARYQGTKAALPYLRAATARDERVRRPPRSESDHTAWDGIVLPVDHPFWTRWFPPLGFRCRCTVIQMTRSQLLREGRPITSEAELFEREARLGNPVFLAPAAPIVQQLIASTARTNAEKMPGSADVNAVGTMSRGANLWNALAAQEAADSLGDIIERLFG